MAWMVYPSKDHRADGCESGESHRTLIHKEFRRLNRTNMFPRFLWSINRVYIAPTIQTIVALHRLQSILHGMRLCFAACLACFIVQVCFADFVRPSMALSFPQWRVSLLLYERPRLLRCFTLDHRGALSSFVSPLVFRSLSSLSIHVRCSSNLEPSLDIDWSLPHNSHCTSTSMEGVTRCAQDWRSTSPTHGRAGRS